MTVGSMASATMASSYTFYGTSADAQSIQRDIPWQRGQIEDIVEGIAASWDTHRRALGELAAVYRDAADDDWDGYGAAAVDPMSYFWARCFLMLLPAVDAGVEIAADPDGELSIEWYQAPDRVFSVSIGRDGRLSYAGRFGRSTVSGTEYFADDIPWEISAHISKLLIV